MKNYIKLNGNNSNDITGLLIQELPPITKPKIRTQIEEINGRDGDIVTNLGYSAYTKEISIGLYGNYNVDDVIAYFNNNKTGEVIFSNEPDKFYNYEIFEQIDFNRLIRFRTATVKMHVQPFKYPTEEEQITESATVITGEGNELSLNNTKEGTPLEIGLKGNTSQETTTGKNLLNIPDGTYYDTNNTYSITVKDSVITPNFSTISTFFNIIVPITLTLPAGTYTYNNYSDKSYPYSNFRYDTTNVFTVVYNDKGKKTFTFNEAVTVNNIQFYFGSTSQTHSILTPQIEVGSTSTDFERYTYGASPNPSYPQEVQVVTGDNTINIVGKNLCEPEAYPVSISGTYTVATSSTPVTSPYTTPNAYRGVGFLARVEAGVTYTFSSDITGFNYSNKIGIYASKSDITDQTKQLERITGATFTPNYSGYALIGCSASASGTTITWSYIQVELGSTSSEYTPYQSQEYEINLGTLELCKIGTYQDYLYKSGENWYKHKEIEKITFIGNEAENWSKYTSTDSQGNTYGFNISLSNTPLQVTNASNFALSNYFKQNNRNAVSIIDTRGVYLGSGNTLFLKIDQSLVSGGTDTNFKTWLSTHNTIVYYVLATPTEEQITNAELIEQLEAILNAVSYEDQTNISQENDNLGFIISASTSNMADITVMNIGNIYAKPLMTINGSGNIEVYLNGVQVLQIALGDNQDITIDVSKMEAYNSSTQALLNRLVTGDYMNFLINNGNNTIGFRGSVTSVTIDNYTRWL